MVRSRKGMPIDSLKFIVWLSALLVALFLVLSPLYLLIKYALSDSSSINTGGSPITLMAISYDGEDLSLPFFRPAILFGHHKQHCHCVRHSIAVHDTRSACGLCSCPLSFARRKLIILGLISVRLFPDIASIIPIAEFFIRLNLQNTYTGVILAHTLLALPYVIFIGMSAFESIPNDLEQQAMVMGANGFQIFFSILLPLAIPGLAAAALYTFLLSWDEFIFSYFLLGLGKNFNTYALPETEIVILAAAKFAGDDIGLFKRAGHRIFSAAAEIYDRGYNLGFGQIGGHHGGCRW